MDNKSISPLLSAKITREEVLAEGRAEVIRWLRERGHDAEYWAEAYSAEHKHDLPICVHKWETMKEEWNANYEECSLCLESRQK